MKLKIAIQGIKGSNHHQVAKDYFGDDVTFVECSSFDILVDHLINKTADKGVMAIENSIAGSIIPNYALVFHKNLHIIGEKYLNIHHNLMALKGQTIDDIKEVRSHGIAAIAPKVAAELYDLEIIHSEIQTIKDNATRFIIVKTQNKALPEEEINKASVRFITDHKRGSLAAILNVMSDCNLNLTKIQSLPVIQTPWKYSFFVDVTFEKYKHFSKAKALLEIMAEEFKVLGEYKNARIL